MNGVKKYPATSSEPLNTTVSLAAGSHRFAVLAINTAVQQWESAVNASAKWAALRRRANPGEVAFSFEPVTFHECQHLVGDMVRFLRGAGVIVWAMVDARICRRLERSGLACDNMR